MSGTIGNAGNPNPSPETRFAEGNQAAVGHGPPLGHKNYVRGKMWKLALTQALERYEKLEKNVPKGSALERIAMKCIEDAIDGDRFAREEIANRLDGKPVQAISGDEDGPPITLKGLINLVRPGTDS